MKSIRVRFFISQGLQSFIQRFDACAGLEPTLRLLVNEVNGLTAGDIFSVMDVTCGWPSKDNATPKSSILIGFGTIIFHHPFWGVYHPYFGKHPCQLPSQSLTVSFPLKNAMLAKEDVLRLPIGFKGNFSGANCC